MFCYCSLKQHITFNGLDVTRELVEFNCSTIEKGLFCRFDFMFRILTLMLLFHVFFQCCNRSKWPMIINDYHYHCHYHELRRPGLPVWCNNLLQLGFELSGVSCVAEKPPLPTGDFKSHYSMWWRNTSGATLKRFKTLTRLHPDP